MYKLSIVIIFLILTFSAWATEVNQETAFKAAKNFYIQKNNSKSAPVLRQVLAEKEEGRNTLFTFIFDKGFVSVAADNEITPVIAYSINGNYNTNDLPPAMTQWLKACSKAISLQLKNKSVSAEEQKQWQDLLNNNVQTKSTLAVLPLCHTKWDQGCYYNALCPQDTLGPCGHAVTGCVATAMAQIMKYWNYPIQGQGTHTYESIRYGTLYADFGSTTYDWASMPDSAGSPNSAVATLMYHCGVAVEMDYYPTSSSAYFRTSPWIDYFKYSQNIKMAYADTMTTSAWINLMKNEIDGGRPVWYCGFPLDTFPGFILPGHAWVCDGYDDNDFLHFNWGWSSLGAYCQMGNYYYYLHNQAVYQILPVQQCDVTVNELISPVSKTFNNPVPVKIKVSNYDLLAVSNIPVAYQIDGGTIVKDTIWGSLAAQHDTVFIFSQTADFSQLQGHNYHVKIFTSLSCDAYRSNDTLNTGIENVICAAPTYSMGFEPGESMAGWMTEDINNDGNTWQKITYSGINNSASMYYYGSTPNADDWLISKCVSLETGKMYKIQFWYNTNSSQNLSVWLGNDCISGAMIQYLDSISNSSNGIYKKAEIYFTVPATAQWYVGWHFFSSNQSNSILLDDILITEQSNPDIGITQISQLESGCDIVTQSPIIKIKNYCSLPISNFQVSYILDNESPVTETVSATIPFGGIYSYTITNPINVSSEGLHTLKVYCNASGDTLNQNDSLNTTFTSFYSATPVYTMGFEPQENMAGWQIENSNHDNYNWFVSSFGGNTDPYCMEYSYSSWIAADDWFFTKCVKLYTNKIYKISFVAKIESNQWPENLAIYMGQTQNSAGMTTQLIDLPQLTNTNYSLFEHDFAVPDSGYWYFGWHCYSDANMFNLYVDDIKIDVLIDSLPGITQSEYSVFPNPFKESFTFINSSEGKKINLSLTDIYGKEFFKTETTERQTEINPQNLPSGIYLLKVSDNKSGKTFKLVKL